MPLTKQKARTSCLLLQCWLRYYWTRNPLPKSQVLQLKLLRYWFFAVSLSAWNCSLMCRYSAVHRSGSTLCWTRCQFHGIKTRKWGHDRELICNNSSCLIPGTTGSLSCCSQTCADNGALALFEHQRSGSPLLTIPPPILISKIEQGEFKSVLDQRNDEEAHDWILTDIIPDEDSCHSGSDCYDGATGSGGIQTQHCDKS
jgi:hypothetical protein